MKGAEWSRVEPSGGDANAGFTFSVMATGCGPVVASLPVHLLLSLLRHRLNVIWERRLLVGQALSVALKCVQKWCRSRSFCTANNGI